VCTLPNVENGQAEVSEHQIFKTGHAVSFSCNEGFSPPHSTTTCQATKLWSPQPVCTEVTCTVPLLINGRYTTDPSIREANEHVPYKTEISPICNEGYMLSSDLSFAQRTCKSDGQWSGTEVNCDRITCDSFPEQFDHRYYHSRDIKPPFSYNHAITAYCDNGYYLAEPATRRCIEPNMWSGKDPECRRITCRSPNTFRYGKYNGIRLLYDFGTVLVPTCNTGYYVSNNVEKRVCELQNGMHGSWSGPDPECWQIKCRSPTTFSNGQYNGSHQVYDFGTVLVPTCNTGYYMSNNFQKRVCEQNRWYDSWSGPDPECRRITCRSPKPFSNGKYNSSQISYDFGSVLVPTCHTGYYMSNNIEKRVCERPDSWSGTEPVCEIVECETPTVLNGHFNSSTFKIKPYRYRDIISIQCDQGYEIKSGSATRTCQANGTWDRPHMECVKIICNDTSGIRQAGIILNAYPTLAFNQSGNVTFNSTFFYLQHGSVEVTCSESRKLTWVTKPDFGMVYNLYMSFIIYNVLYVYANSMWFDHFQNIL